MTKITPRQVDAMATAYQSGSSLNELSRQYHLDNTQVRRFLVGRNVVMRPRGRQTVTATGPAEYAFMREAWLSGHSVGHMANVLACSETTIRRRLSELKLISAAGGRIVAVESGCCSTRRN